MFFDNDVFYNFRENCAIKAGFSPKRSIIFSNFFGNLQPESSTLLLIWFAFVIGIIPAIIGIFIPFIAQFSLKFRTNSKVQDEALLKLIDDAMEEVNRTVKPKSIYRIFDCRVTEEALIIENFEIVIHFEAVCTECVCCYIFRAD